MAGMKMLQHARDRVRDFLGAARERVLFVPYAGVRLSWDDYADVVGDALEPLGLAVDAIHQAEDPRRAVEEAEAVLVGGGNTFALVKGLYEHDLLPAIRARVNAGVPYVGWSAGANVACPTLSTTNDMPIVEPPGFATLGLVPFQINPHYTDQHPPGHGGETRAERIEEFCLANPSVPVVGLPEGTMLRVEGERLTFHGEQPARVFRYDHEPMEVADGDGLQFLMAA